ncbi:MAG: calcium-binding protein [Thermodesulfobacteriota bacterium]
MSRKKKYDSSWDKGNEKLWERKYGEWEKRDWIEWFRAHLSFPFDVERKEDKDHAFFSEEVRAQPFRLGHRMTVLSMDDEYEDDTYGVFVEVQEGDYVGYVPLADTEVVSRDNENFWPVREYVVWFANR